MFFASIGDQIGEAFKGFVDWGNDIVWSTPAELPWLVVLLLGTGIYVTVRMGGIQFRKLGHAIKVTRGDFDDPEHKGDVSHFQALCTALSATVGIGNIAGVALAIHFGGPGAIFWMWITAVFGMCLKYTEVSLAMKYRDFDDAGNASGGPQKYIGSIGPMFKPLAIFFALCAIVSSFGAGNMNQINTMAQTMKSSFGIANWMVGGGCVVLVGAVILGGITRIGRVTSILMPVMASIYTLAALALIFLNIDKVGSAFSLIVSEAFNPTAGFAGTAAGVWSTTLLWGVKRGLFSNESGQGSAPIAHAAAKTDEPLREGIVAMLGPLIDTLIICTMTGLVIIMAGDWDNGVEQEVDLGDKDFVVMTWVANKPLTLASFGEAAGKRGDLDSQIEKGGYGGSVDGSDEDADEVEEKFEIKDGKPAFVVHSEGTRTPAILVRHDAPITFDSPDHLITDPSGKPFTGTLAILGGGLTDAAKETATTITVKANMVLTGADLTKHSFGVGLGKFGEMIVTLTVLLFALSTAISWSYYGDRCTEYLLGLKAVFVYRVIFLCFVFLGAMLPLRTVWDFGDLALGAMTVPNLIAIIILAKGVRSMQDDYFAREHTPTRK